jgi:hypothetical protein
VNFAVNELSDINKPGMQDIVSRLSARERPLTPQEFVDSCLEFAGPLEVNGETRSALLKFAQSGGDLRFDTREEKDRSVARVRRMLQLIVSSREYQFA